MHNHHLCQKNKNKNKLLDVLLIFFILFGYQNIITVVVLF